MPIVVWLALLAAAVVAWLVLLVVWLLAAVAVQGCFLGCLLVVPLVVVGL